MILPTENYFPYENIADYEEAFWDMAFLFTSENSSEKNHQVI